MPHVCYPNFKIFHTLKKKRVAKWDEYCCSKLFDCLGNCFIRVWEEIIPRAWYSIWGKERHAYSLS